MKNAILLISFFLVQLIVSCKSYDKTSILTGDNYKYWNRLSNPAFSYKFFKDGRCDYCFAQKDKDGKIVRKPYGFGGKVYANEWRFIDKTKIEIEEFAYYYELVGDSILKLISVDNSADTISLIKTNIKD